MRICKAPDCSKPARNGFYCWAHYCRLHRYGDLNFRKHRANGESGKKPTRKKIWLDDGRHVQQAVVVVEKALGKKLSKGVLVHHINGDSFDDRNENLLVCMRGLHNTIHARMKALAATGNARAESCNFCHKYELPGVLKKYGRVHRHKICANEYGRNRRRKHENLQSPSL